MPRPNSFTHEMSRKLVCVCCSIKLPPDDVEVSKPRKNSGRLINDQLEMLLQQHITEDFERGNEKYPLSVCIACEVKLYQVGSIQK